jgi:hypothetical protein
VQTTCTLLLVLAMVVPNRGLALTEEGQGNKLQARVAQANVHARGCTARPQPAEIEPLGHEGLLGVYRLCACPRGVGVKGIVSGPQRGYQEQDERCERELHNHVQTCGEERKGEDVLGLSVALCFLEHPLVVDGNGYGEEVPRLVSCVLIRGECRLGPYHRQMSDPLISIDLSRVWSASFFSSLVYASSGITRWSSKVFRLFLRRLRRRSRLLSPVSSSSSSPSALMSSSSKSLLSLPESDWSASDEYSSPSSSAMWSEW